MIRPTLLTTSLLFVLLAPVNVSAQQQIAQDAYGIFQQSCLICHGPDGAYRETLLIEHSTLVQDGSVVPGDPDGSELYRRLITTDAATRMPLGQPQLSPQAINTIRNWILASAPDWTQAPTTDRAFIPPGEILTTIEAHLMSLSPFDRAYARYFTLTHLYNAGEPTSILDEYRKGLNKLINSLSWGSTITNPEPIDARATIFYIDLRHYEWDVNDAWTAIEAEYPYHIGFNAPDQSGLKAQLGRLQQEMKADIPSVHVDWFIAQASLPPLYHDLLSLPLTDRELETRLEVDVIRNLQNAPGVRVWRAGTNNSGVSNNNRVIERHTSQHGAYWKSYDFAGSVGAQNVFTHPLSFTHDGGEVVFNLPNGLQAYYITTAVGSRLDAAPISIVSNPAASDPTVRNGLSCFGCHTEGMKTFEDEVRSVIESNATPAYDKAHALRLYVEQSQMEGLIRQDMARYRTALLATGGSVDDIEPIARVHELFQGSIDLSYAAAVVGLSPDALLVKIDENIGLQNIGLLALDGGSMKRDTWTESFNAMINALDFPSDDDDTPSQPDLLPGTFVHIADSNLRAVIAESLGKSPNASITVEDMEGLTVLEARNHGIEDLTGLQYATNLKSLFLSDWWHGPGNQVSDLSPIAGLINLRTLNISNNPISDLTPVSGLTNLTDLVLNKTLVSDLSPVSGLTNLTRLSPGGSYISDLSPIAGLINLEDLYFPGGPDNHNISDISPLAGLINLKFIASWGHTISDLSPLAGLTKLERIDFCGGNISDLTPLVGLPNLEKLYIASEKVSDISALAGLTGLTKLGLHGNDISDISVLAGLTKLKWLNLHGNAISDISVLASLTKLEWLDASINQISDVSPILGLTNLTWLNVARNQIADLAPLQGLREKITLIWLGNPAIPKEGGPKIEGPWLWFVFPDAVSDFDDGTDLLSKASDGTVTETEIAIHGATESKSVGEVVWNSHSLPPTGANNINDMLNPSYGSVIYGTVSLHSPREQKTTMYVGNNDGLKVWLNGVLIYEVFGDFGAVDDYNDFRPVTLQPGKNVLLVAVLTRSQTSAFFGFEPGTEYTVSMGVSYTFSKTPIHTGDTFTLNIHADNVSDLAGWQFDLAFDPAALEAVSVTEGDFLKSGGVSTFFHGGSIDKAVGKITGLTAVRLVNSGVSGTGALVQVAFKAKSAGETQLTMQNFQFASAAGDSISVGLPEIYLTVEGQLATGDVNGDGIISILDMVLTVRQLGQSVPPNSAVDLNGDGVVSILDLVRVAQGIALASAAPPIGAESVDAAMIESWIAQARLEDDGSLVFKQGIAMLETLLASLIPEKTTLLTNYPNPFNPETWLPYQLAEGAAVQIAIYDATGQFVRRLDFGYQPAGYYTDRSDAAYWDGRNDLGGPVGSGVYFYHLSAGEYSATKKMVILK